MPRRRLQNKGYAQPMNKSDLAIYYELAKSVYPYARKYGPKAYDAFVSTNMKNADPPLFRSYSGGSSKKHKGQLGQAFGRQAQLKLTSKRGRTDEVAAKAAANDPALNNKDATKSTQVDYDIPGYDSSIAVAAGKRLKSLAINLGPAKFIDNSPDFKKLMNQKTKVSYEFKFRMTSDQDQRAHHYQTFRHKWSTDGTIQSGHSTGAVFYPSGTISLQPYFYNSTNAYMPAGVTASATLDITQARRGYTYVGKLSLNDLYDQSFQAMNKSMTISNYGINDGSAWNNVVPSLGPASASHQRMSYPEYWNGGSVGFDPSIVDPKTSPYQIIPCINSGKVEYSFSNKGVHSARIEAIVYRVKKTANLPWQTAQYVNSYDAADVVALPRLRHEEAIEKAYLLEGQARLALDKMQGGNRETSDVTLNPKVKLLPNLKGVQASYDPFVEVSREAFVLGAGDKRDLTIKLPGISVNPYTQNKEEKRGTHDTTVQSTPFDDHCYFICLATNGLLSSRLTSSGSEQHITGNIFCPSEIFCEAVYTENIQAASLKTDLYGTIAKNGGQLVHDTLSTGATDAPATIIPQVDMSLTSQSQIYSQS